MNDGDGGGGDEVDDDVDVEASLIQVSSLSPFNGVVVMVEIYGGMARRQGSAPAERMKIDCLWRLGFPPYIGLLRSVSRPEEGPHQIWPRAHH